MSIDVEHLEALLDQRPDEVQRVAGGDVCQAVRVEVAGRALFAKTHDTPPDGLFTSEAAGLSWLASAPDGPPLPGVVAVDSRALILEWVDDAMPTPAAAERFGRRLAEMHAAGSDFFGAPWSGFIGPLPMDNTAAHEWPPFYGHQRVLPFARLAAERGALDVDGMALIERLVERLADVAGPPEPPSRIHGDLWSGNLIWGADGEVWLVDPAAHGGHRESDLAMLALFGAPHLDRIFAAYGEAHPLSDGWRERVALHQLHPLLVHAALFGGHYGARAVSAARAYA